MLSMSSSPNGEPKQPANRVVLDASAILALLYEETGHDVVSAALHNAAISAINVAEVLSKLAETGMPVMEMHEAIDDLGLTIVPFDVDLSYTVGLLRPATKAQGLSLGDRACLALARRLGVPALTADQAWKGVSVGVDIQVVR